ncbi:MAG: hypothetical protein ISS77_02780 [Phycisphaerae bacterium]|nr:hypothetical protein [Phycisphaerae bacterium]
MTEYSDLNLPNQTPPEKKEIDTETAGKSLSEALRISFIALKIIMVVIVIFFGFSGFKQVGSEEQALVLQFGKIKGIGEERILQSGLHWVLPYPIEMIVKLPVKKKVNLKVDSFWHSESQRVPEKLNPVWSGYCITRGEKSDDESGNNADNDFNIVHSKWQLTYSISDPERFFKNVYVRDIKPGEISSDIIAEEVLPLIEALVEDAVVDAMVYYTIDEAIVSQDKIPSHVKRVLQKKLDQIASGITADSVQLTDVTWPRQADQAFWAYVRASQVGPRLIAEAKGYSENTLNETTGLNLEQVDQLLKIMHGEVNDPENEEYLWSLMAGSAREKIYKAKAYKTETVETARANADYLNKILPEYNKRPELVLQRIYQDAIEDVLDNVTEKIVIQPSNSTNGRELRIMINRDPSAKKQKDKD